MPSNLLYAIKIDETADMLIKFPKILLVLLKTFSKSF